MMWRIRAVVMAGAVVAGAGLGGAVSVAASTAVSACDTVISAPGTYVLAADLDCSTSATDGVVIESSNVTLNLDGYSISGGTGANDYTGVYVYSGGELNHVTVENGTIADWEYDLYPDGVSNFTASKLTLAVDGSYDYYGFYGENIDHGSLSKVNLTGSAYIGFYIEYSADLTVTASSADSGEYGFYGEYNDADSYVNDTANTNSEYGFYEYESSAITFSTNRANDSESGIYNYCDDAGATTLEHNTVADNGYGIYLYDCYGYSKTVIIDSLIKSNVADDNLYGIYDEESFGASYVDNVAKYNGDYGMLLEYPADDTVTGNVASHNGDSGIYLEENYAYDDVDSASNNQAYYNDDYGLYADSAAPGSGNVALDNSPYDCFNFVCASGSSLAPGPAASMPGLTGLGSAS